MKYEVQMKLWVLILLIAVAGILCGTSYLAGVYGGVSTNLQYLRYDVAPRRVPFSQVDSNSREAIVTHVVDGDTVDCTVSLGYETLRKARIRLEGVDTPERGQPGFGAALYFSEHWVEEAHQLVSVKVSGKDKYGRYVGRLYRAGDDKDLSQALLEAGLAQPYPSSRDIE